MGEDDSCSLLSRNFEEAEGAEHDADLGCPVVVQKVIVQSYLKFYQLGPCALHSGGWMKSGRQCMDVYTFSKDFML